MSECESTRGRWGQRCPDCGALLPCRPAPLVSWHAARSANERSASGGRITAERFRKGMKPVGWAR